ncbi:hypothetical protein EOK75_07485 [Pseudorhodobacter turbinis]|uniref:Uncharacterized protein n=1 Tax=Pseudorhodobacter turbinis TaxID=2500533 RepID=A0A4P8EGE4_9RHOB|nr:hypothetical protein [Pseudorhodobacter turbinis]QCO55595.1 hypothetical protein EOK75_07485 [Pseudorhodobacter turbinis]
MDLLPCVTGSPIILTLECVFGNISAVFTAWGGLDSSLIRVFGCLCVVDFVSVGIKFVNFSLCALVILDCCHVFAIFGLAGSDECA